jgi:hypothetical protein
MLFSAFSKIPHLSSELIPDIAFFDGSDRQMFDYLYFYHRQQFAKVLSLNSAVLNERTKDEVIENSDSIIYVVSVFRYEYACRAHPERKYHQIGVYGQDRRGQEHGH